MAIYKLTQEVALFPYTYTEDTGEESKHDTKADALAVNERGKPKMEYLTLRRLEGRLLYETATDFNKMTDADKKNAFYVSDTNALNKYAKSGVVEKVDYSS